MSNSSILATVIGNINNSEDQTAVQINCNPVSVDLAGSSAFASAIYEVAIPYNPGPNVFPVSGGSIIRVKPGPADYTFKKSDTTSYNAKVEKIKSIISQFLKNTDIVKPDVSFSNYDQIANLRIAINKTFYEISKFLGSTQNFYEKDGVPEFILSTVYSTAKADEIDVEYKKNSKKGIRDENISPFLSFQFIPFESILEIYSIISVVTTSKDANNQEILLGPGTFFGNLNVTFSTIYKNLQTLTNKDNTLTADEKQNIISAALIEISPFYRIAEEIINAESDDKLQLGGYYTFYDANFYVKMPDLSGLDSSEYYSNFYTKEENGAISSLFYVLEILSKNETSYEYCPLLLRHNRLPSLSLKDGEMSYPDRLGIQVDDQIIFTGLDPIFLDKSSKNGLNVGEIKYFLSPMIKSNVVNNNILKQGDKSLKDITINSTQPVEIATIPLDNRYLYFNKSNSTDLTLKYGTIPLYDSNLGKFGVTSLDTFLSAINRPEIIISDREDNKIIDNKELLFYSTEQQNTRYIMAGNKPKFFHSLGINENENLFSEKKIDFKKPISAPSDISKELPNHWISLDSFLSVVDKKDVIFKLSKDGVKKILDLFPPGEPEVKEKNTQYFDISNSNSNICFSVYAVDTITGQFVRFPGPNITISLLDSKILSINPNGFLGSNAVKTNDLISIEIIGENLLDAEAAYLVLGTDNKEIANKSSPGFIPSSNSVKITIDKKWSDLTTSIGEFPIYLTTKKTKNKETNKDIIINISPDIATSATLPIKGVDKINFLSFNSIFYQPKGVPAGLADIGFNYYGPDSIPVLFGGGSVKIRVGSASRIFNSENKNNIFAYLAFKDDGGKSAKSLVETFGHKEDVISVKVGSETFYLNKKIVWNFGDQNFEKGYLSSFANISFPGPIASGPYNVRSLVEGPLKPNKGYFIFSNEILNSNFDIPFSSSDKYFPVSILQIGTDDIDKPAFIDPPHVLGMIAKSDNEEVCTSNFDISSISGATKQNKDNIHYKIKKAIPLRMVLESNIKNIKNGKISVQNKIQHLFVIFNAPKKDKKYFKDCYTFYIGSKKINDKIIGKIKYLSNNIACVYFRNISSSNLNGFSEFRIEVNDYEYNSTYNSDVYTKVSKLLKSSEYEVTTSNDLKTVKIKSLEARKINSYTESGGTIKQNSTSLLVPINNLDTTFKYQKYGYSSLKESIKSFNKSGGIYNSVLGNSLKSNFYIKFVSPIKIKPIDLDVTFGNIEAISATTDKFHIFGAVLSDEKIEEDSVKEDVVIAGYSTLEVIQSRSEAEKAATSVLKESSTKSTNAASRNSQVLSDSNSSSDAIALANSSNQSLLDLAGATSGLNALIKDANATAAQITAAVEQVNAIMRKVSALTDALSSANYSISDLIDTAVGDSVGSTGRPTSIISLNQNYCFLPETFEYDLNFISESTDKNLFITITTKIEQNHVIESKIPEIYSITTKFDNKEYYKSEFSNLKLGQSAVELTVKVKGGDRDSKFELGGFRSSSEFIKIDGEFYIYNVVLEPSIYFMTFSGSDCAKFAVTNSNKDRLKAERVLDPAAGQDINKFFDKAKGNIDKQSKEKLDEWTEKAKLKVGPVLYDKSMAAKEFLKSICDMSFHLTAEISAQLKFLKILYIPIKVIFCIIDVICALLHPVKLAFAVVRLFACLFDLILLLPQISMPVLFLTIALHILELLVCVIQKILGVIVAINEIITALDIAIRKRDFESIKNLELTLNEHLFTIEADFQVIEPIVQILGLILELLQLQFSFPCQISQDEDEPACIDPSMLAGLIIGKVAPKGKMVPDAMIPLAQDYTNLSVDRTGEYGNTPDSSKYDPSRIIDVDYNSPPRDSDGNEINNVLYKVTDAVSIGYTTVVADNTSFSGNILPDLIDSQTNENKLVKTGGFFSGDQNGDGLIDNVNYGKLRFLNGDFNASFGISCTKSKKRFSFGTATLDQKNDPRFVEFQFKSEGLTNNGAFILGGVISKFFKKKIIDDLFSLDASPAILRKNGNKLEIYNGSSIETEKIKLISPIDGFSDFIEYAGIGSDGNYSYKAKPLVANIEILESSLDPQTNTPVVIPRTVTKTFGGIPSFAIVDEKFNVYFLEENGLSIRIDSVDGKSYPVIDNIFAKMINFPAAETQKFSKEERQVIRKTASYQVKIGLFKSNIVDNLLVYCAQGGDPTSNVWTNGYKTELGDAILKMQANAGYFEGISTDILEKIAAAYGDWGDVSDDPLLFGSSKPFLLVGDPDNGIPYTVTFNFRKLNDILFLHGTPLEGGAQDFIGINGITNLLNYIINNSGGTITAADFNNLEDIPFPEYGVYEFANGNWAENDDFQYAINTIDVYNFPQIYFVDLRQVADDIAAACGASQTNELLLDLPGFNSDFGGDIVAPYLDCVNIFRNFFVGKDGIVPKIRAKLNNGEIPDPISIDDIKKTYNDLIDCTNKAIDDSCKFVINPLNTTFKLIEDNDGTDLPDYIDPSTVVTEVVTDGAVSTMPTITGAMEYASGIGDLVTVKAGGFATIQIIPRDSYDDEIVSSFDARKKISISIISDTTKTGANIEKIDSSQEFLWSKNNSVYTARITSNTPGKVTFKASICDVVIQAVTERGISTTITTDVDGTDCIPDVNTSDANPDLFPPGALVKVDRVLTVLFVANQFIDKTSDSMSENPSINPQINYTDMVN